MNINVCKSLQFTYYDRMEFLNYRQTHNLMNTDLHIENIDFAFDFGVAKKHHEQAG